MIHLERSVRVIVAVALIAPGSLLRADVVIDSLPYEANVPGETYRVASGLPALGSGTAITITANNVTIDGQGNAITYCDSGPGNAIQVSAAALAPMTFRIENLEIDQGSYVPQESEFCHAIRRSGNMEAVEIINNTINIVAAGAVSGTFTDAISLVDVIDDSMNNIIRGNTINLSGTSAAKGIGLFRQGGSNARWEGVIENNTINMSEFSTQPAGRASGIAVQIDTTSGSIRNNTLTVDDTVDEVTAIGSGDATGWEIAGNTINLGGIKLRGILLDDGNKYSIINNEINITTASAPEQDLSAGIRIRFGSDDNIISGNTVDASMGVNGIAFRIGGAESGVGDGKRPMGNKVSGNTFKSKTRAVSIEEGTDIEFIDNLIEGIGADAYPIIIQENNPATGPTRNIRFKGDEILGGETTVCGASTPCKVRVLDDSLKDLLFCATNIVASDINVGVTEAEFAIKDVCGGGQPWAPLLLKDDQ